jgi:hypothetical protein
MSLRLCRLMCGKALPFRSRLVLIFLRSGEAEPRRREEKSESDYRKAGGFPHIRRQSRK